MACQTNLVRGAPGQQNTQYGNEIFDRFLPWAAKKGQTAARIRGAIDRLNQITTRDLQLDASLEWSYLYARRGCAREMIRTFYDTPPAAQESLKSDIASASVFFRPSASERCEC